MTIKGFFMKAHCQIFTIFYNEMKCSSPYGKPRPNILPNLCKLYNKTSFYKFENKFKVEI